MKLTARSAALYSFTVVGLLALSACGKNDQQQSAGAPPASSTAAAPAAAATAAKPAAASTAAKPAAASTAPAAPAAAATAAGTAPATQTPTADAFQVSGVTVGDQVGNDHKVRKELSSVPASEKTIYASVDSTGSTDGVTLSAKWTFVDGNNQLIKTISQSISTQGPATTTFRLQNPNLWPEGKYQVDISVDGKQVASKNFEVKKG